MSDVEYESSDLDELLGRIGNVGRVQSPDSEEEEESPEESQESEEEIQERLQAPYKTQVRILEGLKQQYDALRYQIYRLDDDRIFREPRDPVRMKAEKDQKILNKNLGRLTADIIEQANRIRTLQGRPGFDTTPRNPKYRIEDEFRDLETGKYHLLSHGEIMSLVAGPIPRAYGGTGIHRHRTRISRIERTTKSQSSRLRDPRTGRFVRR